MKITVLHREKGDFVRIAEVEVNSLEEAYFITQNTVVCKSWSMSPETIDIRICPYIAPHDVLEYQEQIKHRSTKLGDRLVCGDETFEIVGLGFNKIPVKEETDSATSALEI